MLVRAIILACGLASLSGCVTAAVGAAGAVGVTALQDRTLGEGLDDAAASNQLKAKLMARSAERFNEVDVEVANKIALLTGRVPNPEDKIEAERIAWTVSVIRDVGNEIKVRKPGGVKQNLNDEWITARVRTKLLTNGKVKSMNINIETYDGVVYLMGIARSAEELQRAAQLTSKVRGVKEVVSYIQVREPSTGRPSLDQSKSEVYDPGAQ